MSQTIGDIRKTREWRPLEPAYYMPHAQVIDPIQQAYNDGLNKGWNNAMAHLKAAGKI